LNYYEHHLGDYLRDTAHLSMLEDAAYRRLLDRIYSTEQGVPVDQAYRVVRARTKEEQAAVDVVLAEFFTVEDGLYVQARAMAEIAKARRKIETSRNNGRSGGRPKRNPPGSSGTTQEKPTGFYPGSQTETQTVTQPKALQTPDTRHQSPEEDSLRSSSDARAISTEVPRGSSAEGADQGRPEPQQLSAEFEPLMLRTYPPTAHPSNFVAAIHCAMGLVGSGAITEQQLTQNLLAFRAFVDAGGYTDSSRIPAAENWFGMHHPKRYWAHTWPLPKAMTPPTPLRPRRRTADEIEAEERARVG
jgi:uncharacterized protein YdaU (DUF1376 family)